MPYKNKAESKAYQKAYYEAHKAEREAYQKAYQKAYYQAHKAEKKAYYEAHKAEKKAYYEAHKAEKRAYYEAHKAEIMWRSARRRARNANVEFTIRVEDVQSLIAKHGKVCPALGIPFQTGIGRTIPESMTLDRFDPARGYVPGNCGLLSNKANLIKSCATQTELGLVYRWVSDVNNRREEGSNV